jgi:hypothetical protein
MTIPATDTNDGRLRYLTQVDEMSLADEQSAQTGDSDPDTLEVRGDSRAILEGTMNDVRRPLVIAVVVAGTVVLVAVVLGALIRTVKHNALLRDQ